MLYLPTVHNLTKILLIVINAVRRPLSKSATKAEEKRDRDDPRRPMALPCGHNFCNKCLQEYLRKAESSSKYICPVCRAPIDPASGDNPDRGTRAPPPLPPRDPQIRPSSLERGAGADVETPHSRFQSFSSTHDDSPRCSTSLPSGAIGSQPSRLEEVRARQQQELLFRAHRLHYLFPDVVDRTTLAGMQTSIQGGDTRALIEAAMSRHAAVTAIIQDSERRAAAASSGFRGSSGGSWGGGSSGGGAGGRW